MIWTIYAIGFLISLIYCNAVAFRELQREAKRYPLFASIAILIFSVMWFISVPAVLVMMPFTKDKRD